MTALRVLHIEKKNESLYAFFRVLWLKTNTLNKPGGNRYVSHRFVEERTEFADNTRWLQTSPELRAITVLKLFDQSDIDPKTHCLLTKVGKP